MFKYILMLAVAFGGYKAFIDPEGFMTSSSTEIHSDEHKFQVFFPNKPEEKKRTIDLSEFGKFKLTSYEVRSPKLKCMVSISEYLDQSVSIGDIYDLIESSRKNLLTDFGGKLDQGKFIYNANVTGYEFNVLTNSEKLLQYQIYLFENKTYNVTCQFQNDEEYKAIVNDFMKSFTFI